MTDFRRAGSPRHGAGGTRSVLAGTARVIVIVLVVAVTSIASVVAIGIWQVSREFRANAVDISNGGTTPTIAAMDGAFNVLLVGEDNAPGQNTEGFGHDDREGARNDVNILVHVSADHEHATVLSFPRDLEIAHPECHDPKTGESYAAMAQQPLNVAFSRGGLGCVVATIHSLTGIDIPYAALFSFEGTVKMADAVGGVPICVTKAIDDPDSGLVLPAGTSVVTGRTALAYLRSRHGVADGSDLGRIASQQAYMSSLMRVMTSAGTLTNPEKLYSLAQAAAKNISLSDTLADPDTMVTMALALKSVKPADMVFVQYPAGEDPDDTDKLVPSTDLDTKVVQRIIADQPFGLGKDALRYDAEAKSGTAKKKGSSASASPKPSSSSASTTEVIDGLNGQTGAQHTCSVAFDD